MTGDMDAQESVNSVGKTDSRVFWTATYTTVVIWGILFLT